MSPIRESNGRNSSQMLRNASVTHRHPFEELHPQLLRILSRQMQRAPLQTVNTYRARYRPTTFIRANQLNGLLSRFTTTLAPGLSSIQFFPEPLVGQLIRRTLESSPVQLMFTPRHNNPVLIIPSTIVESINLTITAPTSLIPSGPIMGYKVTMIPKIEEKITEIWRNWLGISQESNIDLSTIPESFLNQPVRPPMRILFWNRRGAGNVSFRKAIGDLIHQHNPSVLILMETVISDAAASRVIEQLGFSANFCLDPHGFSGGMWILWKTEDLEVHATSNSNRAIHAVIQLQPSKANSIPSSADDQSISSQQSNNLYHELRRTALVDLNETTSSSYPYGGLLGHTYSGTNKREEEADLIKELFLKAHGQQFFNAHPNYYYPTLLNRRRNSKTKKKKKGHVYQKSSRSSLMRLAKVIQCWKAADKDWATPPFR